MNLKDLKKAYSKIDLPKEIILNEHTKIYNPKKFIETHFSFLESNSGNERFKPYYDRLLEVYNKLK